MSACEFFLGHRWPREQLLRSSLETPVPEARNVKAQDEVLGQQGNEPKSGRDDAVG